MKRVFISDCEGPISKNDDAFEITAHFVPSGRKIFTLISKYDDATADLIKRPGYRAGDTLKLVLPFLKAYNVTDMSIKEFSARNLVLMPRIKNTLTYVMRIAPAYVVSTSYEHYVEVLCKSINFPFKNTYSTKLCLDTYALGEQERTQLRRIGKKIAKMPIFEIPQRATNVKDLSLKAQTTISKLDEIFWGIMQKMQIGRIYSEVNPIGGAEKAEAIVDVVHKLSTTLADVVYFGDSITDKEALKLVKENDGLAVSFNGNRYAIENADIALMSPDSMIIAVIVESFVRHGKRETLRVVANWNRKTLEKASPNDALMNTFFKLHPRVLPKAKIITTGNMAKLARESCEFRKRVRGETAGRLG